MAPVDNQPVLNTTKAGRAVPLKWHVTNASAAPVTTLTTATGRLKAGPVSRPESGPAVATWNRSSACDRRSASSTASAVADAVGGDFVRGGHQLGSVLAEHLFHTRVIAIQRAE